MDIIKNGKTTIYYYRDLEDLLTERDLFNRLQINLCDFTGEKSPVRIHPIEEKEEYHILLWNSGDKNSDVERLRKRLNIFKIEFDGEL